jgi:hypothetical protein
LKVSASSEVAIVRENIVGKFAYLLSIIYKGFQSSMLKIVVALKAKIAEFVKNVREFSTFIMSHVLRPKSHIKTSYEIYARRNNSGLFVNFYLITSKTTGLRRKVYQA